MLQVHLGDPFHQELHSVQVYQALLFPQLRLYFLCLRERLANPVVLYGPSFRPSRQALYLPFLLWVRVYLVGRRVQRDPVFQVFPLGLGYLDHRVDPEGQGRLGILSRQDFPEDPRIHAVLWHRGHQDLREPKEALRPVRLPPGLLDPCYQIPAVFSISQRFRLRGARVDRGVLLSLGSPEVPGSLFRLSVRCILWVPLGPEVPQCLQDLEFLALP